MEMSILPIRGYNLVLNEYDGEQAIKCTRSKSNTPLLLIDGVSYQFDD